MPLISSCIISVIYICALIKFPVIRRDRTFFVLFTLFAIRLVFSFNHDITFQPAFAGQSLNSLLSIFTVLALFLMLTIPKLKNKALLPFYIIILSVISSTIFSMSFLGGAFAATKWFLLVFVVIYLNNLLKRYNTEVVLKPFMLIFFGILISQMFSVLLNQGKDTESLVSTSNSISYIAGYAHEAGFSILLYLGFFVSSILMLNNKKYRFVPLLFFIGMLFANYRTTILASLVPLFCVYYTFYFFGKSRLKITLYSILGVFLLFTVFAVFSGPFFERFAELGDSISSLGDLMSIDYTLFTRDEMRLLSSRLYLWNMYINSYIELSVMGLFFGAGPEAWSHNFNVYAHNNFVGILYDLGLFGLMAFILLFLYALVYSLYVRQKNASYILVGNIFGFFVMSNATMPFWAVEGLYAFAFIYAVTLYFNGLLLKTDAR